MGFDVIGTNPVSRSGEYFRNSMGCWLGLWRYCLNLFPDIAGKVQHWNTNDGDGLDAEDAMALSRLLEETLEDGTARDYQRGFAEYLANIPDTACSRCNGNGQVRGFVEWTHPAQADEIPMAQLFPTTLGPSRTHDIHEKTLVFPRKMRKSIPRIVSQNSVDFPGFQLL